jgi:EmrB/QacA subfamily drug resistance transporter
VAIDPALAHDRRWWTLGVLCLSLTVIGVDNTILNVALPSIVESLGARGSQLQWIIDAYTIVFACLLLTAGALGDRFGRKGALTAGLVLFGVFSALASQSGSATQLIVSRGLMGIGGALIFPTTLSILTNTFTGRERARAIGIWAGVSGLGIVVGPLLGGALVEHFFWGSVFLVNVPLCIAAIVLGHYFIPTSKAAGGEKLDPAGAMLSILGLSGVLYAIIEAPDIGWTSARVLGGGGLGLLFLAAFAVWEFTSSHPMLDVRFFRNPRFSAASGTITLVYFALFGSTFLLTQYFQFVLGYSPLKAGMMTAPVAIGLMAGAPNAPKLAHRYGTKLTVLGGLVLVMAGLLMYSSNTIMS